ncbi:ABC transporter permease [Blautia schinkii]|nr:ABC transporter permease [Blautia schinkii]
MWKLIRLEYKKNKILKYVMKVGVITAIALLFFFAFTFWGIALDSDTGKVEPDMVDKLPMLVTACMDLVFMVFTTSMYSSFLIEPYQNKSIHLMFTYPVSRKKVIVAKIAAVWMFSLIASVFTRLVVFVALKTGGCFFTPDFLLNYSIMDFSFWSVQLVKSIEVVTIVLLAVWGGMDMKSTRMAVIFSIILIVIMQGAVGDLSLRSQSWLPLILAALAIVRTLIFVAGVEKKDVPDF